MSFFTDWAPKFMSLLMKDFDLSDLDAAAIIGNAGHESAGFKALQELKPLVPGSRGGYGIMQWTGPRRRDYENYCSRNKLNPADMMSNYKFLFVELKGPEGKVIPKLKETQSLAGKTEVFMKTFLRPGIPHLDSRQVWAQRALDAYRSAPKTSDEVSIPKEEKPSVQEPVVKKRTLLEKIIDIILMAFGMH